MKIAFYTLGCKVNQYETQALEQLAVRRGHTLVSFEAVSYTHLDVYKRQGLYSMTVSQITLV